MGDIFSFITCKDRLPIGTWRLLTALSIPLTLLFIFPGVIFWIIVHIVLWVRKGYEFDTLLIEMEQTNEELKRINKHIEKSKKWENYSITIDDELIRNLHISISNPQINLDVLFTLIKDANTVQAKPLKDTTNKDNPQKGL